MDNEPLPLEIPMESLSPDALSGIIESFILREGTDYGAVEASMEAKQASLLRQLSAGEIKIVFDAELESLTLMTLQQWRRVKARN